MLFDIAGGVALILFGIRFLRKALQRLLGRHLQLALKRLTEGRLRAFALGMAAAVIAPSSTGIAAMAAQMMRAGRLSTRRMLAVVLGASVGITAAVQLVATDLEAYAPVFLVVGILLFQAFQKNSVRGIGQIGLAIGFIFLGMDLIGQAGSSVDPKGDLAKMLLILKKYPVSLTLMSAVMTVLMQSTTAVIGLGIGFASLGPDLVGMELLVPLVLGANLGVGFTNLLAGWFILEGRRLGASNVILRLALVGLCLAMLPELIGFWQQTPGELSRQIANLHTGFNLLLAALGLPLISPIDALSRHCFPQPSSSETLGRPETHLDSQAVSSPWVALMNAERETQRMVDLVKRMLFQYWQAQQTIDLERARQVQAMDDQVDQMNNKIKEYLNRINEEELTPEAARLHSVLLNFVRELEAIGDTIDRDLCQGLLQHPEELKMNTSDDQRELESLFQWVAHSLTTAASILGTRDSDLAQDFLTSKRSLNEECLRIQQRHHNRFRRATTGTIEASSYFLDTIENLRKINSHATGIAYDFVGRRGQS